MSSENVLELYYSGPLTVVGFGGRDILDNMNLGSCRDELMSFIKENHCHTLAFDLTGVKVVPSGLLGLLASITKLGVTVHLYNACSDIKEVLDITKLNRLMELHSVEV